MRVIRELLGHEDISTTEIYLYVSMSHGLGVSSPLDQEVNFLTDQPRHIGAGNQQSRVSTCEPY